MKNLARTQAGRLRALPRLSAAENGIRIHQPAPAPTAGHREADRGGSRPERPSWLRCTVGSWVLGFQRWLRGSLLGITSATRAAPVPLLCTSATRDCNTMPPMLFGTVTAFEAFGFQQIPGIRANSDGKHTCNIYRELLSVRC